jgi:hypothetical protein
MKPRKDLEINRRGVWMTWPVYIIHAAVLTVPWWVLASNISFDEVQKSIGLIIAPTLLGLTHFIEKVSNRSPQ